MLCVGPMHDLSIDSIDVFIDRFNGVIEETISECLVNVDEK
jgi:hypothetical protein